MKNNNNKSNNNKCDIDTTNIVDKYTGLESVTKPLLIKKTTKKNKAVNKPIKESK